MTWPTRRLEPRHCTLISSHLLRRVVWRQLAHCQSSKPRTCWWRCHFCKTTGHSGIISGPVEVVDGPELIKMGLKSRQVRSIAHRHCVVVALTMDSRCSSSMINKTIKFCSLFAVIFRRLSSKRSRKHFPRVLKVLTGLHDSSSSQGVLAFIA